MNQLFDLANGFIATSIIIIVIGIINYKTLVQFNALRVLFYLVIISVISDIASTYMQANGIHNIWLFNVYNIIEYSLFAVFYLTLFNVNKSWKLAIGIFYIVAFGIMIIATATQSFQLHLNSASMGLKSIILICSAVFYFKDMLSKLEYETPWENPFFWINSGILLFFSGGFFIFIFSDYRDTTRMINLWDIHNIIHIIYNILIIIGFWKARKI